MTISVLYLIFISFPYCTMRNVLNLSQVNKMKLSWVFEDLLKQKINNLTNSFKLFFFSILLSALHYLTTKGDFHLSLFKQLIWKHTFLLFSVLHSENSFKALQYYSCSIIFQWFVPFFFFHFILKLAEMLILFRIHSLMITQIIQDLYKV